MKNEPYPSSRTLDTPADPLAEAKKEIAKLRGELDMAKIQIKLTNAVLDANNCDLKSMARMKNEIELWKGRAEDMSAAALTLREEIRANHHKIDQLNEWLYEDQR
jgi:uncharacterized coiled-coil DUF342 family protein